MRGRTRRRGLPFEDEGGGARGREEATAAAKERERKREEKQRWNAGALGACESAFAALRCAEGERKVSYQTAEER